MKATAEQIAKGLAASYALRDSGDPANNVKPTSFTANPSAHVRVILEAVLADVDPRPRAVGDEETKGDG